MNNLDDHRFRLDLNAIALILTVLDKEAHMSSYFSTNFPDVDDSYISTIRDVQHAVARSVPADRHFDFLRGNPHLMDIFDGLLNPKPVS